LILRTQLSLELSDSKIRYSSNILSIGSCFSVSIGQKLANLKYNIVQNPAGITFNPVSILSTIRACISGNSLPENKLFLHNGLWSHPDFHGSYNHPDKLTYTSNANSSLHVASDQLKKVNFVFITIGTAYVFEDIETDTIVNNCHKKPASHFRRRLLDIEEIEKTLYSSIQLIDEYSDQSVHYIITVSPVRHVRDGLQENLRSKSRLIEAVHKTVESHKNASYFPSYEIMIDDLRDYRFYKPDMIHPSDLAVDYIYEKFSDMWLDPTQSHLREAVSDIYKSLNHSPLFPDSEAHAKFKSALSKKMENLQSQHSHIDYTTELQDIQKTI